MIDPTTDTYIFPSAKIQRLCNLAVDEAIAGNRRSTHELNIELLRRRARPAMRERSLATQANLQAQIY